ncbi:27946_t:CDS:2, partial [Gigaspora margarita]
ESMNHLMKGYIDATTLLLAFIQAFEIVLNSCKECIELEIYQQDNNKITFQTTTVQLNLEELPTSLFYLRWYKNISELELAQYKIQQFTKANPYLTEKFVNSIRTILELEIKTIELNQQPSDDNKINYPLIAKTKGAPKK